MSNKYGIEPMARVLRGAAEVIERNGWYQGDYFDSNQLDGNRSRADCPVCALGALNLAAGNGSPDELSTSASDAAHALEFFLGVDDVVEWNDHTATAPGDVTKALRDCANQLEREWA